MALGVWLACTLLGAFLIDLDSGPSLVSLTMSHGLSLVDAIGAALLLAGWSAVVLTARRQAWPPFPVPGRLSSAALLASCAGLLTAALLVPDFAGRKFVVAGFVLLVEGVAAATLLAAWQRRDSRSVSARAARPRGSGPRGWR
jgi:hypothetical protein